MTVTVAAGVRRELAASFGGSRLWIFLAFVYVYSLGACLLIGSAGQDPAALDLAAVLWGAGDLAVAAGAAAGMARFDRAARDLRLPQRRAMRGRMAVVLVTALVIVPSVSFRVLIAADWPLQWITWGMPLIFFLPWAARFVRGRERPAARAPAGGGRRAGRAPRDAVGVYLRTAFVPVRTGSGKSDRGLLAAVLWSVPLLAAQTPFGRPLRWLTPYYLGITAYLVWAWSMTAAHRSLYGRAAAFEELALLPGLGDPRSQRRAFYRAALARPLCLCAALAALALFFAWSSSPTVRPVVQLGLMLALFVVLAGCTILAQLSVAQIPPRPPQIIQLCGAAQGLYLACRLVNSAPSPRWTWGLLAGLSLLLVILVPLTWRRVRRLAELPQPFLQ